VVSVTRIRRLARDQGAELVEFAIVLPLLLLLIAGIVDFGFLFQQYEVVTNAAREGARIAVLPEYANLTADVQTRVSSYVTAGGLSGTPTTTVDWAATLPAPGGTTVPAVRVTVTYPHPFLFIGPVARLFGGGSWGTLMLSASTTMRLEPAGG
jgi:Flp pilus assembly protein TadG